MRKFEQSALVDEELHDLKLRFELLEGDRKAYYETSQWAIRRNKEEINNLRQQNKHLSEAIARIKKTEIDSQTTRTSMTELEKFDRKICETQKKYDELHSEVKRKEKKYTLLLDQLSDLTREADMVQSNMKDSPQAKEIRMLENRLDKAMIKYNETQSIKKTYEMIVKRLQEERLTFDNQLANFEKSLRAKKQDAAELEMMSRDANHAKEVAKAELTRFEQQINEERKQREKDLQLRKEMVKHKLEVVDKLDKRVTKLDDQNADSSGKDDTVQLDEATEKKMTEYEETMRLIKEVTGVSDITEVIAKFQSQKETLQHLTNMKVSNEKKIEMLKQKKVQIMKEYEELKFTGEAKQSHNQQTIEDFKKHLLESKATYQEAKQKCDRALKLIGNAKAGVQHLVEKLDSVKLPDQTSSNKIVVNFDNITDSLQVACKKLEILASNLQNKELPEAPPKDPSQSQQPGETVGLLNVSPSLLPTYNCRIKLRPVEFEDAELDEDDENDDEYEVPDRESMKKQTAQMLNARLKTKQAKKTKKKKNSKEENEAE